METWKKSLNGNKPLTESERRFKAVYEQNMVKAMTEENPGPIHGCFELWKASASFEKPRDVGDEGLIPAYRAFLKRIGAVTRDA